MKGVRSDAPQHRAVQLRFRLLVGVSCQVVRAAARATLRGLGFNPTWPEAGRLLRADVDRFLALAWEEVFALLDEEDLSRIPTAGNQHNAFLGVLPVAAHQPSRTHRPPVA